MKEEMRVGKRSGCVEAGFGRAWNRSRLERVDLITATILYLFGSSTIRGFAFVLIIGVLVSISADRRHPLDPGAVVARSGLAGEPVCSATRSSWPVSASPVGADPGERPLACLTSSEEALFFPHLPPGHDPGSLSSS